MNTSKEVNKEYQLSPICFVCVCVYVGVDMGV